MGLIHVTTTLRASEKARKKYAAEFFVDMEDTGATDSLAPAKEFDEKLGKGFMKPEQFVRIAYTGLLKHR